MIVYFGVLSLVQDFYQSYVNTIPVPFSVKIGQIFPMIVIICNIIHLNKLRFHEIPQEQAWKVQLLFELLQTRTDDIIIDGFPRVSNQIDFV